MYLKISVCIPVYNCAEYLAQALDSILPQANENVEVVVFDGGSTDDTSELMERYVHAWPNLRYHQSKKRGGIDADMAACVELAEGEYCWLFSGDDVMHSGAIRRVLKWLALGDDIYICKHTMCRKDMTFLGEYPVLLPDDQMRVDLAESYSRCDWFGRSVTTEGFFSFMSGLIVRKAKWQDGQLPKEFERSCWGHVARLFGLITSGLRVCYVAEALLDKRGENDSFADKGIVNRYRIAVEGYHRLADYFFGFDSLEAFHIRRVLRNGFGLVMFLNARIAIKKDPERESREVLNHLFKKTYIDTPLVAFFFKYAIFNLMPIGIYEPTSYLYRWFGRISRTLKGCT
jgi:abequosyltransferase